MLTFILTFCLVVFFHLERFVYFVTYTLVLQYITAFKDWTQLNGEERGTPTEAHVSSCNTAWEWAVSWVKWAVATWETTQEQSLFVNNKKSKWEQLRGNLALIGYSESLNTGVKKRFSSTGKTGRKLLYVNSLFSFSSLSWKVSLFFASAVHQTLLQMTGKLV